MIQAIKNGNTKLFSEVVWNTLGKEKNGWVKLEDSIASNSISNQKTQMPNTGEKAVATNQVVENELTKVEATISEPIVEQKKEVDVAKKSFFDLIKENLTKNVIKNYLDDDAVNVPYSGNTIDSLSEVLYTHFNGDIAKLQEAFKIS